jgi:DNA-binding transcriptional regulator YiaG
MDPLPFWGILVYQHNLREETMGKLEALVKLEILRLAKREIRRSTGPLQHEVRVLKGNLSQVRKSVIALERIAAQALKQTQKEKPLLEASPEEVKASRLSPRLIQTLRKHLGISQKELATLVGVTTGAVTQWEAGQFKPANAKKAILVGLRKLGRRDVKELLEKMGTGKA